MKKIIIKIITPKSYTPRRTFIADGCDINYHVHRQTDVLKDNNETNKIFKLPGKNGRPLLV